MTLRSEATPVEIAPFDLSSALRRETHALHGRAERSGIVADILRGRATRRGYALFLRNLLPAYQELEVALERHRATPGVDAVARRELYRAPALEADIGQLYGPDWPRALPLLPAARRYADCIAASADGEGEGLIGHAYVRYLGDLSGGQILKRLLTKSLGLAPSMLTFYEFPEIGELAAYKQSYRDALDSASLDVTDQSAVVAAAVEAFAINIEVSEAVWHMIHPAKSPSL